MWKNRLGWLSASLLLVCGTRAAGADDPELKVDRETLAEFATFLERDWADRPEWAVMAASVLKGESMGPGTGWFGPSQKRYTWSWLKERCDADGDDRVARDEFKGPDGAFAVLDRDGNGRITDGDLDFDRRPSSSDRPAAMAGELFYRLDGDSNGRITAAEMEAFFAAADRTSAGFLVEEDLVAALREPPAAQTDVAGGEPEFRPGQNPLVDLRMLLSGQFGSLGDGPKLNDAAPDFLLRAHDSENLTALSQFRGDRPVVLIFGSFT